MKVIVFPSPGQQKAFRIIVVICLVLLILISIFRPETRVEQESNTYTYSFPLSMLILPAIVGLLIGATGVVFFTGKHWILRAIGVFLFLMSVYLFLGMSAFFTVRVVVAPDSMLSVTGHWWAPVEHRVVFSELVMLDVTVKPTSDGDEFELECFRKPDGEKFTVPMGGLMREALPRILQNAEAQGVGILWDMIPDEVWVE